MECGVARDAIDSMIHWNDWRFQKIRQVFRIFPPSIIALNISIKALKMYRYSSKLIQTNYNIISHHDNTNYYNFVMLTIT